MDPAVLFFVALILALVAVLLWPLVKYGGWKAASFGAKISRTVGEVPGVRRGLFTVTVKVHRLVEGATDRAVALEVVAKSPLSYQVMPVTLTEAATRDLVKMLDEAGGS